jgi:hypothetical protein
MSTGPIRTITVAVGTTSYESIGPVNTIELVGTFSGPTVLDAIVQIENTGVPIRWAFDDPRLGGQRYAAAWILYRSAY